MPAVRNAKLRIFLPSSHRILFTRHLIEFTYPFIEMIYLVNRLVCLNYLFAFIKHFS
jgi:hypothetical protein